MSDLISKLEADLASTQEELQKLEDRQKMLRWQAQYITKLLDSARAHEAISDGQDQQGRYARMTIADVAMHVLQEAAAPLSGIEIAKRAMAGGFQAANLERARSHFSAVISKDIGGSNPKFWQIGRGEIGLVEWKPAQPTVASDMPKSAPRRVDAATVRANAAPGEDPFPDAPSFTSDDIPF